MKKKKRIDLDYVKPLIMTEEDWANSQLSIARYYGRIKFKGNEYVIVNKEGKDVFECSAEAEILGRQKAIEAGEPADLCLKEFIPVYRWLGRDELFKRLKAGAKPSELLNELEKGGK